MHPAATSAPRASRSRRGKAPDRIEPQLATPVATPPEEGTWFSELKLDGYRVLCRVDGDDVVCQVRNGADWSARLPTIVQALRRLGLRDTWLDGELVAVDEHGRGHFQLLQRTLDAADQRPLLWYAFDVLWADGVDCRPLPLAERRVLLAKLLAPARRDSAVRVLEYAPGYSDSVFDSVCGGSLEGVMLKQVDAPYASGRSRTWLKLKCRNEQEFVVGGYTRVPGGRDTLSALLLGQFDGPERLRYVGRAGSGFDRAALVGLRTRLDALQVQSPPFERPPRARNGERIVWTAPQLVVQARFAGWTADGLLRLPRYAGLRTDLPPGDVQQRAEPAALRAQGTRRSKTKRPGAASSRAATARLTNPSRLVFRDEGITKAELAKYYATVERWLWPHLAERPVSLLRVTEGGRPFLQRHRRAGTPLPGFVDVLDDSHDTAAYIAAVDPASLATLGQYSCVELHTWGCRLGAPDSPDRLTFDLDPDPLLAWTVLRDAALLVRQLLETLELESFVKTSGGRGLHVVVPLTGKPATWEDAASFTSGVANHLARTFPHLYAARAGARNRTGRVFVDHLRNRRSATTVAAYSPRFRKGAPVSMPLAWADLGDDDLRNSYSLRNAVAHADTRAHDPWQRYASLSQRLTRRLARRFPA
jgi:bifunctional non-homologous end joining protein LigD